MPKKKSDKKVVHAGRYSEILPGLLLGNKDALEAINGTKRSASPQFIVRAVACIGGGKANKGAYNDLDALLRIHIDDRGDTSMLPVFKEACEFIEKWWHP